MNTSVESKVCSKCKEVKLLEEFYKSKDSKDGHQYKCKTCERKYYQADIEKKKEYSARYRADNSEKCKVCHKCKEVKLLDNFSKSKASKDGHQPKCRTCVKSYKDANVKKIKEYQAKWCADNSEEIKDYQAKYQAKYQKTHPEKCRAKTNKRRAHKLLAIPSWLTKEDYQVMESINKEADRLTQETGVKYEVDHIHPLQGKLICGFHCPSNLQILTKSENCSKGNRFTPYVESELT